MFWGTRKGSGRKRQGTAEDFVVRCFIIYTLIKSGRMGWAGYIALWGRKNKFFQGINGKPKGRTLVGRPRFIWDCNIQMHLKVTV